MDRKLEELAAKALELEVEARAALAKTLLDSLDELSPEEHERLWVEEAESRYQGLRAGELTASPSDDVFERLQARRRR